jgi:hypothetical protein
MFGDISMTDKPGTDWWRIFLLGAVRTGKGFAGGGLMVSANASFA